MPQHYRFTADKKEHSTQPEWQDEFFQLGAGALQQGFPPSLIRVSSGSRAEPASPVWSLCVNNVAVACPALAQDEGRGRSQVALAWKCPSKHEALLWGVPCSVPPSPSIADTQSSHSFTTNSATFFRAPTKLALQKE